MLNKPSSERPKYGPEDEHRVTTSLLGITHRSISSEHYNSVQDIDTDRRRDEKALILRGVIAALIGLLLIYGGLVGMSQDKAIYDIEEYKIIHQGIEPEPGQQASPANLLRDISRRHLEIDLHNLEFFGGIAVIAQAISSTHNRIAENSEVYHQVKREKMRQSTQNL